MPERTTAYNGETHVETIDKDVGILFDEVNKGLDPNLLPPNSITSDRMRFTLAGTGSTGYLMGGVQTPISGTSSTVFNVQTILTNLGVSAGQYYDLTPYFDIFVDPIGSSGSNFTLPSLYAANNPTKGGSFMVNSYFSTSSSNITPEMYEVIFTIHNFDASAHYYYLVFNIYTLNSQFTKSQ